MWTSPSTRALSAPQRHTHTADGSAPSRGQTVTLPPSLGEQEEAPPRLTNVGKEAVCLNQVTETESIRREEAMGDTRPDSKAERRPLGAGVQPLSPPLHMSLCGRRAAFKGPSRTRFTQPPLGCTFPQMTAAVFEDD